MNWDGAQGSKIEDFSQILTETILQFKDSEEAAIVLSRAVTKKKEQWVDRMAEQRASHIMAVPIHWLKETLLYQECSNFTEQEELGSTIV